MDWNGDAARDIEPEPGGTEENHHRHDGHEKIGASLDWVFHRSNLRILHILTANPFHLRQQGLRHEGFDDHDPFQFTAPTIGGHGNARAHESTGLRLLNGGDLLLPVEDLKDQLTDRQI